MGFWNVQAKDLRVGDEIRVTVMGGEEFLTVREVNTDRPDGVGIKGEWAPSLGVEPVEDVLPRTEKLVVRR